MKAKEEKKVDSQKRTPWGEGFKAGKGFILELLETRIMNPTNELQDLIRKERNLLEE